MHPLEPGAALVETVATARAVSLQAPQSQSCPSLSCQANCTAGKDVWLREVAAPSSAAKTSQLVLHQMREDPLLLGHRPQHAKVVFRVDASELRGEVSA